MKARVVLLFVAALLSTGLTACPAETPPALRFAVRVEGDHLVNENGDRIILRGVNRSGLEHRCVNGVYEGFITDDPPGTDGRTEAYVDTVVAGLKAWKVNAVRLPLNESCWNGTAGGFYSGGPYQRFVQLLILKLGTARIVPVLDLHWASVDDEAKANGDGTRNDGQDVMPNRLHSLIFWRSIAQSQIGAKADGTGCQACIFDLANEPSVWVYTASGYPAQRDLAWAGYRDGFKAYTYSSGDYMGSDKLGKTVDLVGVKELVHAIRDEGANNVIGIPGLGYSNSFDAFPATFLDPANPIDTLPTPQLATIIHTYDNSGANANNTAYLNGNIGPTAAKIPVLLGEFGERTCDGTSTGFDTKTIDWFEQSNLDGAFAWAFDGAPKPPGSGGQQCNSLTYDNGPDPAPRPWGLNVHAWLASH